MKTLFNIFFLTMLTLGSFAQNVGVNSTGVAPDNSAMLDVVSADKGMLVPRVNIIDLNTAVPVTAPATSLLVYNTNATSGVGFYFWDGTKWTKLADANSNSDEDWYEVGGTLAPDDINDNIFTQGNVGIGMANPQIKFVVSEGNSTNSSIALEGFSSGYVGLPTILPASGSHFGGIVHGGTNGQLILGIRENDVNDGLLIASGGGDYMSDNTYDKAILFARNNGDVGIGTVTPQAELDVEGDALIGLDQGVKIHNSFQNSAGSGPRELFRVSQRSLCTGGFFTIAATRGNYVHNSTWSWSSNHHAMGRGMLTQLSGGQYSDIHVYLDVNSSGDAIISADWGTAQSYSISIIGMSGSNDLNVNSTGTDWTVPNVGYTRVADYETKGYSFQTQNGLFNGNLGVGTNTPTAKLQVVGLLEFADNAAALAGGLTIGAFYRTGDLLKVVH